MKQMAATVLAALMVAGCSTPGSGVDEGDQGGATVVLDSDVDYEQSGLADAPAFEGVRDACTGMGLSALASDDDNVVFSPLSLCMALGMLAGGSTNDARSELESLFGAPIEDVQVALNALAGELRAFEVDPATVDEDDLPDSPAVHRATNVVVRPDLPVEQDYLDSLSRYFDSTMEQADLSSEDSKAVLDEWIHAHTGGRIEESAIQPNPDLVLVLQDALLFAAAWQWPFNPPFETFAFHNEDGSTAEVPRVGHLREMLHAEAGGFEAAQVPFTSHFSATFILPPASGGELTSEIRTELLEGLQPRMVQFSFPRFHLAGKTELLPLLGAFGIDSLTQPDSRPLDGIADVGPPLFLGQAAQQAVIDVGEAGAVAAAVTELGVEAVSAPMVEVTLVLNRPFYLLITHDETTTDLFQTAVRNLDG